MSSNAKLISYRGYRAIKKQVYSMLKDTIEAYNHVSDFIDLIDADEYSVLNSHEGVQYTAKLVSAAIATKHITRELNEARAVISEILKETNEQANDIKLGFWPKRAFARTAQLLKIIELTTQEIEEINIKLDETVQKLDVYLQEHGI